jgi:hypothetical protein
LESPYFQSLFVVVMLVSGDPAVEDEPGHHAMCEHPTAPVNRHMSVEMTCHARAARSFSPLGVMSALFVTPIWYQLLLISDARRIAVCLLDGGHPYLRLGSWGELVIDGNGKSKKRQFQPNPERKWMEDSTFQAISFFGKTYVVIATLFTLHYLGSSSGAGLVGWPIERSNTLLPR